MGETPRCEVGERYFESIERPEAERSAEVAATDAVERSGRRWCGIFGV